MVGGTKSSRSEGMGLEGSKSEGRRVREGLGEDMPVLNYGLDKAGIGRGIHV